MRGLGVTADSYGGLLTSILMKKLPLEIRLIISQELTEKWDVEKLMKLLINKLMPGNDQLLRVPLLLVLLLPPIDHSQGHRLLLLLS